MVFLALVIALVIRLWFLQVLTAEASTRQTIANSTRPLPDPAPRGQIFDRNGVLLATNLPSMVVSLDRSQFEKLSPTPTNKNNMVVTPQGQEVLNRLSAVLQIPVSQLLTSLNNLNILTYTNVPVARGVSKDQVIYIQENQARGANLFPGVTVQEQPLRNYPNLALAGHVLGYVGQIGPKELNSPAFLGDASNSMVGRTGLEQQYERALHGTDGRIEQIVNVKGEVQGTVPVKAPVPGNTVVSTLDVNVQNLVEQSLAQGIAAAQNETDPTNHRKYPALAGSAVVMNPNNGQVLAMASYPSYDPNVFIGGISTANFNALNNDPSHPLTNRVLAGVYPPGSTFKVVSAAAALGSGLANAYGTYPCPSTVLLYKQNFKNFDTTNGSSITLSQALVQSCDTVFYNFGDSFYKTFHGPTGSDNGPETLQSFARQFGLGSPTGVDLPGESSGLVPDNKWLQAVHKKYPAAYPFNIWLPGYTVQMAIGQGDMLATPLQMAAIYGAIANGGTIYQPTMGLQLKNGNQVVQQISSKVKGHLPVSPSDLAVIQQGLLGVVADKTGTANAAFAGFPIGQIPVAGKTGTADVGPLDKAGNPLQEPDAWFDSYAPANNPQFVVVVNLENGGFGAQTAAPIAKRIYQGLFNQPVTGIGQGAQSFG